LAEEVLTTITFVCGTTGTLVAKALNLIPPMVPSRIQVAPQVSGSAKGSAPMGSGKTKAA
jgi:hypothetical protein